MHSLAETILEKHLQRRQHAIDTLGEQAIMLERWADEFREVPHENGTLLRQFGVIDPRAIRTNIANLPYDVMVPIMGDTSEDEGIIKQLGPKINTPTYKVPTIHVTSREAKFTYVETATTAEGNYLPAQINHAYGLEEKLGSIVLPKRVKDWVPELREAAYELSRKLDNDYIEIVPVMNIREQGLEAGVRVTESIPESEMLYAAANDTRAAWTSIESDLEQQEWMGAKNTGLSRERFHQEYDILHRRIFAYLDNEAAARRVASHKLQEGQTALKEKMREEMAEAGCY